MFAARSFLLAISAPCLVAAPVAVSAQARPSQPVPDPLALSKLLWSTMAAIDHANKTGNYSVLRSLGSPGFQTNNDAATLAAIFAGIREERVDLADTLVLAPTFEFQPAMIEPGILRMRGLFNLRPTAVGFDLVYEWSDSGWRLHGVAIMPFPMSTTAPTQR